MSLWSRISNAVRGERLNREIEEELLPPAETYIGEKRLKPSGSTNAVARLAGTQRGAECTARFLGIPS